MIVFRNNKKTLGYKYSHMQVDINRSVKQSEIFFKLKIPLYLLGNTYLLKLRGRATQKQPPEVFYNNSCS